MMSRLRFSCRIRNVALECLGSILSTDITPSGLVFFLSLPNLNPTRIPTAIFPQIFTPFFEMALANPETWTHEPSIIKKDDLREVAVLLGKGFRVHHLDVVGAISLSYNHNPQKYMVMQYHSVENGFRLPLHGLLRDLCRHFGFAPGQLTANAHNSISRTKFAAADLAEEVYNALRDEQGLIPYHSLQDTKLYRKADFYYPLGPDPVPFEREPSRERSKAPSSGKSNPAMSPSGNQSQGGSTALAVCKPAAALEAVPISAIPGLRRPTPSQKRPREGHTIPTATSGGLELPHPDSLDCEGEELRDQFALKRPAMQPQPEVINSSPHVATAPQVMEEEGVGQKEPEFSPTAEKEVEVQKELDASSLLEKEAGKQKGFPLQANLEKMRESVQEPAILQARPDLLALNALHFMEQAQQSLLTLTEEYLGGASGNYRAVVLLKEKELAARALQQKVDTLEQHDQVLQDENARLKENGSMELAAERLRAQLSILESKASASEDKVGSLKAELVERESRISELESSLQEAKYEGSRLNELALKHMEARRLTLEKLGKERQTASELRSRMGELEKAIAAHQEEVAGLTARAEALYEEGKFDMQHCIYEAVRSGLPAHRSLDDFISHYGLPLPFSPPDSRADSGP
ncbi:unnamed protein product [Cuscuta campestris]|uniref:Uncharacterized protein n=1 Tax=Cuscuta campestris TaxID=132261 RepID=A0A484LMI1_9ASTE|nr:unnamed protein product [Cuscuta campestris]